MLKKSRKNKSKAINVEGKVPNKVIGFGLIAALIVAGLVVFKIVKRKK
mgnify:FL=1